MNPKKEKKKSIFGTGKGNKKIRVLKKIADYMQTQAVVGTHMSTDTYTHI